jgi:hypothetical protein
MTEPASSPSSVSPGPGGQGEHWWAADVEAIRERSRRLDESQRRFGDLLRLTDPEEAPGRSRLAPGPRDVVAPTARPPTAARPESTPARAPGLPMILVATGIVLLLVALIVQLT